MCCLHWQCSSKWDSESSPDLHRERAERQQTRDFTELIVRTLSIAEHLWIQTGSLWGQGKFYLLKAKVCVQGGDQISAQRFFGESLRFHQLANNPNGIVECIEHYVYSRYHAMDQKKAALLLGVTSAKRREIGAPVKQIDQHMHEATVAHLIATLGPSTFQQTWEQGGEIEFTAGINIFRNHLEGPK